jgi:hypothetical protein
MKTSIPPVLITFALACFALVQNTRAVSPPPDGGYPGGNTAEGQNALLSIITGTYNTAIGVFSLESNTAGTFNTAIGAGTLLANIADSNTATGAGALLRNTIGFNNTANGAFALFSNTSGNNNTANGAFALYRNVTGSSNVAVGYNALTDLTTGSNNIALGTDAGAGVNTGNNNIDIGSSGVEESGTIRIGAPTIHAATFIAGINGVTITAPISVVVVNGDGQLGSVDIATFDAGRPGNNTAEGDGALINLTTGLDNTAMGFNALFSNTTAPDNTAVGDGALYSNTTTPGHDGYGNTAIGFQALFNNTTGPVNTALGDGAGLNATTGSSNVYIGAGMAGVASESNACYIASIFGQTSASGVPVFINSNNKLGTATSSKRFKDDIKPMDKASEALLALKPVTFHYKKEIDPTRTYQFGLVAEEVEKVNPHLVVRDKEGKPYTVRYEAVNAMLLNEFLKEHRTVQEQKAVVAQLKHDFQSRLAEQQKDFQATAAHQQKQIEALTAGLQKVSAQLEASKPAQQVVNNP